MSAGRVLRAAAGGTKPDEPTFLLGSVEAGAASRSRANTDGQSRLPFPNSIELPLLFLLSPLAKFHVTPHSADLFDKEPTTHTGVRQFFLTPHTGEGSRANKRTVANKSKTANYTANYTVSSLSGHFISALYCATDANIHHWMLIFHVRLWLVLFKC